jgi:hypothetical protein
MVGAGGGEGVTTYPREPGGIFRSGTLTGTRNVIVSLIADGNA